MDFKPQSYNLKHNNLNYSRGQILIELMIAMAIFVLVVAAVTLLVLGVFLSDRVSRERMEATFLAQEGIEAVRSIRDRDFDNLIPGVYGLRLTGNQWVFSGNYDKHGKFTRQITISNVSGEIDPTDIKKIESEVTWKVNPMRENSLALTNYLTDWQQTQGDAGELWADISQAVLGNKDKELRNIKIQNIGSRDIIIDKITAWWDNSRLIREIVINGITVWSNKGPGSPKGNQSSGTELDIDNFLVGAGSGEITIDKVGFNGSMSGATFIILFRMIDDSTKYLLVKPGEAPSLNQANSLAVDLSSVHLDPADSTKVIGIIIENTGASDIVIDKMIVSWTGKAKGNKIQEITIGGNSLWTGNADSGVLLDISNFTLSSGAGSYLINSLDFKKDISGATLNITFIMEDGSIKYTENFSL